MNGVTNLPLPAEVAPGQSIDLTMNFTAPIFEGSYRGNWLIRNEKGQLFGTTATANRPFWVDIQVKSLPLTGTVYDFVASACSAQWFSGSGTLPCPGKDKDPNGFVLLQSSAKLEDGTTTFSPSLLTAPQNINNGYIRAVYPSFKVQNGDHLQVIVNCEGGATSCGVLYRIDYELSDGLIREFWAFGEFYDHKYYNADIDLTPLAGQNVRFVLTILSLGDASGDRALWVQPRIVR
jgi:Ig-like domain-containing protein